MVPLAELSSSVDRLRVTLSTMGASLAPSMVTFTVCGSLMVLPSVTATWKVCWA